MIRIPAANLIGNAIRFTRNLAGLTQRQLAEKTGFKQTQIAGWEVGAGIPNMASCVRLFDALGYDFALIPREDS